MRFITLILVLFFITQLSFAQKNGKKPNIIFILADDLGYGDVGCYGQQKILTPNIDQLAKNGMRFTQFYSGTAVCAPARCSFMTGQHTGHTAIRGNITLKPEGQMPLPDSSITIAMRLKEAGYTTAAYGKWSLGFITSSGDPQKKGFDEFYGYNCQTLAHNYFPDHLWHNHERIDLSVNLKKDSVYSADLIHSQAMSFLRMQDDRRPFFMYLAYTLPHADVFVPHDSVYEYYVKKFSEPAAKVPSTTDEEHSHYDPYPHAAFAAMVSRLDKYVGEIMRILAEKHLDENTLVIFSSDNGPHKEKGGDPVFFNSNGNLRGIKRDLYEGGIREPFITFQKGVIKGGAVNATPAALWDLYPTFLEMAGTKLRDNVDGVSILASLKGQPQKKHDYFYWELQEAGGKQAVRMGDWKGVRVSVSASNDAPIELYDLATDPGEKNNVAAQHPDVVKKIEEIMKSSHTPNRDWPLLPNEIKMRDVDR
jgi:arylsulfatase A-like enzyme